MKPLVFAALLFLLLAGLSSADEVFVPDNNPAAGSSNAIPFWAEWSAIQGQIRFQMLFDPTQLGNRAFTVHDIAFAANYSGSFSATQMQIRLSHCTVGTLSATMDLNIPNPVVCFDGPASIPTTLATWTPMGLTNTFTYNGKDFLVMDLRYMGGATSLTGSGSQGRFRSAAIHRSWAYTNYYATTESGQDRAAGLKTRFTVSVVSIVGSGTTKPGSTVTFALSSPTDAGLPYQVGTSVGTGPIPIDTRQIDLGLDDVLVASTGGALPSVFEAYSGYLDATGAGQARFHIPNIPLLVGIRFHTAFLTIKAGAPSNVKSISPTYSFTVLG
ncbi:MAG: hypothetical protein JXQ29_03675 [Planctomycetes bacterium]|nr:hypothetical protein [Planctomycetota bacterium]